MRRSAPLNARVLIAGAGPVGMAVALVLARAGIAATVLERADDLTEDLRASTWHPPTLDMLDAIDASLVPALKAQGLVARHTSYRDRRTGLFAEFDMACLGGETAHPYRVQSEQFKFTRLVAERLRAFPHVRVRFGCKVETVEQGGDGVTVGFEAAGERETLSGDYLVGADGAWSAVRQAVGVEFEGFTYPERFYVASTAFDFARHLDRLSYVNYVSDPDEWCVLLRTPDLWRVLFPTRVDERDEDVVSDASTEARLQAVCALPGGYETAHRTIYRVHQRVARRYRVGRVFLAGDAAHINNPLGGMGMNGGLHDGVNLADKLVKVLWGEADEALLDLYQRQRRPIAVDYINANTARNKQLLEERDPAVRAASQDEMRRVAEDPVKARAFLLKTSMIEALRAAERVQ
jgi:3-(3-hydroxy-phenyl)propionate hydroxylase